METDIPILGIWLEYRSAAGRTLRKRVESLCPDAHLLRYDTLQGYWSTLNNMPLTEARDRHDTTIHVFVDGCLPEWEALPGGAIAKVFATKAGLPLSTDALWPAACGLMLLWASQRDDHTRHGSGNCSFPCCNVVGISSGHDVIKVWLRDVSTDGTRGDHDVSSALTCPSCQWRADGDDAFKRELLQQLVAAANLDASAGDLLQSHVELGVAITTTNQLIRRAQRTESGQQRSSGRQTRQLSTGSRTSSGRFAPDGASAPSQQPRGAQYGSETQHYHRRPPSNSSFGVTFASGAPPTWWDASSSPPTPTVRPPHNAAEARGGEVQVRVATVSSLPATPVTASAQAPPLRARSDSIRSFGSDATPLSTRQNNPYSATAPVVVHYHGTPSSGGSALQSPHLREVRSPNIGSMDMIPTPSRTQRATPHTAAVNGTALDVMQSLPASRSVQSLVTHDRLPSSRTAAAAGASAEVSAQDPNWHDRLDSRDPSSTTLNANVAGSLTSAPVRNSSSAAASANATPSLSESGTARKKTRRGRRAGARVREREVLNAVASMFDDDDEDAWSSRSASRLSGGLGNSLGPDSSCAQPLRSTEDPRDAAVTNEQSAALAAAHRADHGDSDNDSVVHVVTPRDDDDDGETAFEDRSPAARPALPPITNDSLLSIEPGLGASVYDGRRDAALLDRGATSSSLAKHSGSRRGHGRSVSFGHSEIFEIDDEASATGAPAKAAPVAGHRRRLSDHADSVLSSNGNPKPWLEITDDDDDDDFMK